VLSGDTADLPLVLLYRVDRPAGLAQVVSSAGPAGPADAEDLRGAGPPPTVPLGGADGAGWPLDLAWRTGEVIEVGGADVGQDVGRVFVLPAGAAGPAAADALLILGTALRLVVDDAYIAFLRAAAAAAGAALAAGRAAEREAERAEAVAAADRARSAQAALADELGTPLALLADPLRRALDVPDGQPLGATERAGLQLGREIVDRLGQIVDALRRRAPPAGPSRPMPAADVVPTPAGRRTKAGGGPVVLVAESAPEVRALLAQLLRAAGWRVHTVADGRKALEGCRRHAPDLLLASATLPGTDGLELVRAVRADRATERLPVVLTGGWEPGAAAPALAAGADDHLARPFDPDELLARLRARLEATRTRTAEVAEHRKAEQHLRIALAAREHVGTAVGLVMAQRRCSAEEAFGLLRSASQRSNVKLAEVARSVVMTADMHGRGV